MYLSMLALPLLSATLTGLGGSYLGRKGGPILSTSLVFLTAFFCSIIFWEVGLQSAPTFIHLAPWIVTPFLTISWDFSFDSITAVMLIVVTFISALVHLYSTSYMEEDPHLPRFMSYLSLFTFFMLILITADNIPLLFMGWEGVGMCSYLLINFWFTRMQANKAAIKAMVVNRVGDMALSLGMFSIFVVMGALDFSTIFSMSPYVAGLTWIGILLFIGAVGKSAQLGLHTWLPDAMEGPTPVSALIHAATMVTAGVYLIISCSPLFEFAPDALWVVAIMGALTAFFAATVGVVQNDMKRVIAYSTCSQLGYMIFAAGLSNYTVSLFHLMNHAFFKALLFLSAGAVIHGLADEQDLRKMGGLVNFLPFTYSMLLIGSLSLMGFPFLTGFYSKDVVLEMTWAQYTIHSSFAYWLGTLAAFFTAYYSIRLLAFSFINRPNFPSSVHIHEAPLSLALPLAILAVGSIFVGYVGKDLFLGLGSSFFGQAIYIQPQNASIWMAEFLPATIKLMPVLVSLCGFGCGLLFNLFLPHRVPTLKGLYTFFNNKWYFDQVYNMWIVKPLLTFGHHLSYKGLDRGLLEILGPTGLTHLIINQARFISMLQSGYLYHYAFTIFVGTTAFMILVYHPFNSPWLLCLPIIWFNTMKTSHSV